MFRRLAVWILGHRFFTALALLLGSALLFSGVRNVVVDFSATAFFAGDGEDRQTLDRFREFWGTDDKLAVVLVDGGEDTLLTAARLSKLKELTEAIRATDAVDQVTSITDIPQFRVQFGNPVPWGFLTDVPKNDEAVEGWREGLVSNPSLVPGLLSEDSTLASIVLQLSGDVDDVVAVRQRTSTVRSVLSKFDGEEELTVVLSGVPAVRSDIGDMILQEQVLFVAIAGFLMAALMLVLFRRFYGVVIPLVSALTPCLLVFGIMGWMGEPIGLLNQAYFTLIPVIAIADAIHLVSRFREEFQRGLDRGEPPDASLRDGAIKEALTHIGAACLLTTMTTVVGFCSLMTAEMPVLRTFGLYAAVGIALAYVSVLCFIPVALSVTQPRLEKRAQNRFSPMDAALRFCGRITTRHPWACLGGTSLLIALSIWQGSSVVVDNHLTGVLPHDSPTHQANVLVDEKMGGVIGVRFDLFGEKGVMVEPGLLTNLLQLESDLESIETVREVHSPASLIAYGATVLGGPYAIPNAANIRRVLNLDPDGEASQRILSSEYDRAQIIVQVRDVGANAFQSLVDEIKPQVDAALADYGVEAHATGTPYVAYAGINRITSDLRTSLLTAFVAVTLLVTLLFRSIRVGILFLPANALPLLFGYGFMGFMGWPLEPTTGVVFTVALGIAVDDSIHMMARFREELSKGLQVREAIEEAVLRCGRAVTVTTIVLACGFFVNLLSSFPYTQALGGLGGLVILSALFCDLLVLPPLLMLFYRKAA